MSITVLYYRGDAYDLEFAAKDEDGVAHDLTGLNVIMTVNSEQNPKDADNELFQLIGTVTDGPNGLYKFTPTFAMTDLFPATYYFDHQVDDGALLKRTIEKGLFVVSQELNKD